MLHRELREDGDHGRRAVTPGFFRLPSPRLPRLAAALAAAVVSVAAFAAAQDAARVEQVGWLTGCWESGSPPRTVEEQWSSPRGETMLGTGRTVRDGRTVDYEFVLLKPRDGRLAYEAHLAGQPSAVFLSKEVSATRAVFENLEHDFPQRVGYERRGGEVLTAWVEGTQNGRTRRADFSYRRVPCP